MPTKINQTVSGIITSLTEGGGGVIERPKSKPYLVYHTIPGEEVVALTKRRDKKGFRAELQEVLKPSEHRNLPLCPHAKTCGGCKWQHVAYQHQLAIKKDWIKQAFAEKKISLPEFSITSGGKIFFYRNRMDFMFGWRGELGLKEAGRWWSTIDLKKCFLMSEESNEILKRVRAWTRASGLPFWDNKKYTGLWRALIVREGKNTGERLVILVTNKVTDKKTKDFISSLPEALGSLATSVIWGINEKITDLSLADEIIALKGNLWLEETINNLRYKISPCSFFQTNSEMAAKLQETVLEFAAPKEKNIADLYCGAGFFSLALVRAGAKKVVGVEADTAGIETAEENKKMNNNGMTKHQNDEALKFQAAKIEDYFKNKNLATGFGVVVLDPPRAGLHPRVIETLLEVLPPEIVYVSCNFRRLVEELPKFLEHYEITAFRALDLFPQTPHVEAVVKIEKTKKVTS